MPDTTVTVTAGMPTTVTVTGGVADVTVDVQRGIPGAAGATGAAGPNSVTSATTSDGTCVLSIESLQADSLSSAGESLFINLETHSLNESGTRRVDWANLELNSGLGSSNELSVDWGDRNLYASDGETIMLEWSGSSVTMPQGASTTSGAACLFPAAGGTLALTDDPRFTDARTPLAHTHVSSDIVSVTSQRLIGRHAGGSGAAQEVTVGNGVEFQGSGIRRSALTGDVTASAGSNSTTLAATIAGAKTLSGQLELTGQAATNKTSAMTKDLAVLDRHVNSIRRMAFAVPSLFTVGGGSSAVSGDMAVLNIASAAAGSIRGASFMDGSPHSSYSGVMLNFARPFIASGVFYIRALTADTTCARFLIGGAASRLANANAFSANGLGIEIKNVTSVGITARLLYFSDTLVNGVAVGYVETAFANFGPTSATVFDRSNAFVLTNDGLGTVNLFIQSYVDANFTTTKPPLSLATPLITITDAPKAAASASSFTASVATTAGDAAGVNVEMKVRALQFDYNN